MSEYCELRANKFEHYAARFAAQSFFKAIGTGWRDGTAFSK
jgi:holo-[acyl-carrier protein] synthase